MSIMLDDDELTSVELDPWVIDNIDKLGQRWNLYTREEVIERLAHRALLPFSWLRIVAAILVSLIPGAVAFFLIPGIQLWMVPIIGVALCSLAVILVAGSR